MNDLLDIIIISYNRKEKLEKTLNEFLEKSPLKHYDITVIDNCSTDGTSEMIEEYSKKYPNLKHVRNKINIGGNPNIIRAFETATKKYLWLLGDDDFYHWENWHKLETAMRDDYDMIITQGDINGIADVFYYATLISGAIYKTDLFTNTVITNAFDNVRNLFPHLAVAANVINHDKKIYMEKTDVVEVGTSNECGFRTYVRGLAYEDLPETRANIFWAVGYLSSVELITNLKKRYEVIEGLRHHRKSLFDFFKIKISVNKFHYNNLFYNYYMMFRPLNFSQKVRFILAYLIVFLRYLFVTSLCGYEDKEKWSKYFKLTNQARTLKNLSTKLKNKKVVVYGGGIVSNVLFDEYNMSQFNIVAVCDRRFSGDEKFHGYKTVNPDNLNSVDADFIIMAVYFEGTIRKYLASKNNNKKICSLVKTNPFIILE